jgi:hypothetical protein|tara:strand:- start:4849 stop:5691 length:843 start_codon:yes stop_codon:yes gene_type:complete
VQIKINATNYKVINTALKIASSSVPKNGVWLKFHKEYGLGVISGKNLLLTATERYTIAEIVKKQTDLDPRIDDYKVLSTMGRIDKSKLTRYEKLMSLPPREKFLEVRMLSCDTYPVGFQGMLVDQLCSLEPECIVSVENFDVFVNLQRKHLDCIKEIYEGVYYIVYVGDNIASPKAVKALREKTDAIWINFGDFDPSGIHIGVTRLKSDYLLLPSLEYKENLVKLNNPEKHSSQHVHSNIVNSYECKTLRSYITFIEKHHIAIMQEQLISHDLILSLVKA